MRFRACSLFQKPVSCRAAGRAAAGGFTLLEFCIVMIIAGIMYGMLFSMMYKNREVEAYKMQETMHRLQWGMAEYFRIFGYYPCPANPALAERDANFGVEVARAADGMCVSGGATNIDLIGGANGAVRGMVPVRTLNTVVGCSDVDTSGRFASGAPGFLLTLPDQLQGVVQTALNSAKQVIMAGGDPAAPNVVAQGRRCINPDFAFDPYDNRIAYMVTRTSTNLTTINPNAGILRVNDAAGNEATTQRLHFVLVSAGPDRKGGYTRSGALNGTACAGPAADNENCDNDALFINAPWAQLGFPNDNRHFDDTVAFSTYGFRQEDTTWRWGATALNEANNTPRNITLGNPNAVMNLGRSPGAWPAGAKLVVGDGNIRVDGNVEARTGDIRAQQNVTSSSTIQAEDFFFAPQYCYDNPITVACGAPP